MDFSNDERDICVEDGLYYTHTNKSIRQTFVSPNLNGGKVEAFNEIFEPLTAQRKFWIIDDHFKFFTSKFSVIKNSFMKYLDDFRKRYENEYSGMFDDYRQIPPKIWRNVGVKK